MKLRDSKSLIKLIESDGWYLVKVKGSHHQFKRPTKPGRVTISHPRKDIPRPTVNSILKQSRLKG